MTKNIRLIVLDIDGVVSDGEARPLDLELLADLAAMNRAARSDPEQPAITICTGRPAPYLEVMLQAINGHLPGVYESGAGIYSPLDYRFTSLPEINEHLSDLGEVTSRLEQSLVRDEIAYFQPGKQYSLTLYAYDRSRTSELTDLAAQALGPLSDFVDLVYSTSCLNILLRGVDKGKGVEHLSGIVDVPLANMLGVGDSDIDLPFLELVGFSAAPANANSNVKDLVEYVSREATSEGVRDILSHFKLTS